MASDGMLWYGNKKQEMMANSQFFIVYTFNDQYISYFVGRLDFFLTIEILPTEQLLNLILLLLLFCYLQNTTFY